ncbi:MAG: proline--tRNA ligase [Actinobacteria bacterium]|uniref:proline--tRNA ligase n=1 Tax=freshwater metagenome TaxID=449393 RepID=A0A6J5ZXR5_9ZZZZ|nr:proline--tRNA ligase [Actinomycetota bacterium]
MKMTQLLLPTEREAPADAQALSHVLGVRAGLIRQLGAGLWTWLPAGWRVHSKVTTIIREEMDAIGAQELLMPIIQPRELWQKTGRDKIDELFSLQDRKGAELVLAMTHEEAVTFHVSQIVRSYRDLPLMLYHLQLKARDEPRPRAGVLRTREFIMKDSYSFDRDQDGLEHSYQLHIEAYDRIFDRSGLEWYRVESDVGVMGGSGAHEYMAPCPAGENEVALAPGYAANVEVASAEPAPAKLPPRLGEPRELPTPGKQTIEDVSVALELDPSALLKAFPVVAASGKMVLAMVRGDHRVNEFKLRAALGEPFRPATEEEITDSLGPVGYIGPVGAELPVLLDTAVADQDGEWVVGANRPGAHLAGVAPGRDFAFESADIRSVEAGDLVGGQPIRLEAAIEVGNIFKLGTRYSEPLGATYLDEEGKETPIVMGSYGIGPARIAAAAIEQNADEKGISWPKSIAPWQVELIGLGKSGTPEADAAEALYAELQAAGVDVLFDERDAGPGEKFTDAELLGCPLRLTLGKRSLESGALEVQQRSGLSELPAIALGDQTVAAVIAALAELK